MNKRNIVSLALLVAIIVIAIVIGLSTPKNRYVVTYDILQYQYVTNSWTVCEKNEKSSFRATSLDDLSYQVYEYESSFRPYVIDSIHIVSSVIIK